MHSHPELARDDGDDDREQADGGEEPESPPWPVPVPDEQATGRVEELAQPATDLPTASAVDLLSDEDLANFPVMSSGPVHSSKLLVRLRSVGRGVLARRRSHSDKVASHGTEA